MKVKCPCCQNEIDISLFVSKQIEKIELPEPNEDKTLLMIAEIVCENAGITIDSLRTKSRERIYVKSRQQFMFLSKMYSGATLKRIGRFIRPEFDHTTVIHGINTMNDLVSTSYQDAKEIEYLIDKISEKLQLKKAS